MRIRFLPGLLVIGVVCLLAGRVNAELVPNGDFAMFKPGTGYTELATFESGNVWVTGTGDNLPVSGGLVNYANGGSSNVVDIPYWNTPVGTSGDTQFYTLGMDADGTSTLQAFGTWSGGIGNLAESDPLPALGPNGGVEISAYFNGDGGPVRFDLLVDGTVLTPDSSQTPTSPTTGWELMTRHYNSVPSGAVTIVIGTDPNLGALAGTRQFFDNVSISLVAPPTPGTLIYGK